MLKQPEYNQAWPFPFLSPDANVKTYERQEKMPQRRFCTHMWHICFSRTANFNPSRLRTHPTANTTQEDMWHQSHMTGRGGSRAMSSSTMAWTMTSRSKELGTGSTGLALGSVLWWWTNGRKHDALTIYAAGQGLSKKEQQIANP